MSNKRPIKLAVLSLIGLLGLAACSSSSDEIYAKPSNYDDPIVTFTDSESKIHNDILSVIYDAMHDGSASSKLLDETLYLFAESVFGSYNKITAGESTGITLKDAYISYTKENNNAKIDEFIKGHKAYWELNDKKEHIDADGNVIPDGAEWTPSSTERNHVVSKFLAIESRIAEAMFNKISGGSYTTKNYFSESDFLKSLYQDSKKVNYVKDLDKMIIPYTVEGADIFDSFKDFNNDDRIALHRAYYQDSAAIETTTDTDPLYKACKYTYIEDEVIPSVYNDLLVEQYLLDEDIAAVRNSRARKINVIKINKYSNFSNNADFLINQLVEEIYSREPAATANHVEFDTDAIEGYGEGLFEKYATISKGLYDQIYDASAVWTGKDAKDIVKDMNDIASDVYELDNTTDPSHPYYKHTTYGDLVEDLKEINDAGNNYEALQDTKYSTFTSSGTRTVLEGFEQQKIDIMQSESITKGWYIQSKTPSLDSNGTINDRLFKLSVANGRIELDSEEDLEALAELNAFDRFEKTSSGWQLRDGQSPAEQKNKFLCSINGMYFLKFEGQYSGDDWKNDIVYDDGNAYYVVQVIEAAKDSKLRNTSATSYAMTRGQNFMDDVIDEVAKIVGETGSYTSLSRNHWLEVMSLVYHDQKIYDYFKDNYPDLFD